MRTSKAIEATPNQPKTRLSPLEASACLPSGPPPGFILFGHPRVLSVILEPRPWSYRVNRSHSIEPQLLEGAALEEVGKETEKVPSFGPGTELGALHV